jgi:hypothetical protein
MILKKPFTNVRDVPGFIPEVGIATLKFSGAVSKALNKCESATFVKELALSDTLQGLAGRIKKSTALEHFNRSFKSYFLDNIRSKFCGFVH